MGRVEGKVAIVTGGASGLGAADARVLAAEGAAVILTDIDVTKGEALAEEIGAEFFEHDVSQEEAWVRLMEQTVDRHGGLDVLVNNAGIAIVADIERTTNHDVKAIEYYLRECLQAHPSLTALVPFIHFGCTSEDINNLAYGLMLQSSREVLCDHLLSITQSLHSLSQEHSSLAMLAHTHGQPASPTTLGKELFNVVARLRSQLSSLKECPIPGKFNGAVGNFNAHVAAFPNHDWPTICQDFVESLKLQYNPLTTQIEPHDQLAALMHHLIRTNNILIDYARDTWHYISMQYFTQLKKSSEVGSSTMPHKINPNDFENAEGNLGMANAIAQHLANKLPISRLQRDLSDSTVQRNIGVVMGHSLLAYQSLSKGLAKIEVNKQKIQNDVAQRWELLAEPIQTVLRANGDADAYEKLKTLTRGENINQVTLHEFIQSLDIRDEDKQRLLALTPGNYIGLATQLCEGH